MLSGTGIDFIAIAVKNAYDEHRLMGFAVVGHRTIAINELKQVNITGTERQRRGRFERTLDSHVMSGVDDIADAHLLTDFHCYGVDTLSESSL